MDFPKVGQNFFAGGGQKVATLDFHDSKIRKQPSKMRQENVKIQNPRAALASLSTIVPLKILMAKRLRKIKYIYQ